MNILTIIVVSYNTEQLTLACLRSIYEQTHNISYHVIVIDNNSSDNSVKLIEQEFSQVQLIALHENLGFAKANNLAATHTNSQYILLLNPDTVVLENAIEKIVGFAEQNSKAGIWGGKTLNADYSLNPTSCWGKMTIWSLLCRALQLTSFFPKSDLFNPEGYGNWQRNTERKVDIVAGCFFLIRRELWEKLNGFDNTFFMYGEEVDLCLRAKKQGFYCMITPDASIIHYCGASEKIRAEKEIKLLTAKVLLIKKHWHFMLAPIGIFLLAFYVINKKVLLKTLTIVKPNAEYKELLKIWDSVWKKRKNWLNGDFKLLQHLSNKNQF